MREARVFGRADCHLCHRACDVLAAIARDTPLRVEVVDIDLEPRLSSLYGDRIPVIQVDGVVVAEGRVSEYRLRRALGVPPSPRAWLGLARAAFDVRHE